MRSMQRAAPSKWAAGLTGVLVGVGLLGVGSPASANAPPPGRSGIDAGFGGSEDVIVRTATGQDATTAEAAVRRAGGTVLRPLAVISGFAAQVPRDALSTISGMPGVVEVTTDGSIRMTADSWTDVGAKTSVGAIKIAAGGSKGPASGGPDTASLTGDGIGVALIDSGVAPVEGLDQPGKVINGPDLSFESQAANLRQIDTYGHGTHMAGIIAGSDPATPAGTARFDGVAPGAHIISIKVAAADGASDVSQVIAAIDWVVTHHNDKGLNIRVLNLSFGTDSTQDELLDPLSYAVEAAWRQGIVVVVAVGNDGATATRVTMPAANPYVIAVGAVDPNGTVTRADDTVATFSSRGSTTRHADVLAAGRSVVSLRAPGSYIDTNYPGARVADDTGQLRYFRGSGTSQATAVVSGTVALLLQQRPTLIPDQVKRLLMQTADPLTGADPVAEGAGQIDIAGAAAAVPIVDPSQKWPAATGLGTLEGARGSAHVADSLTGAVLTGERDIFGAPWVPRTWTAAAKVGKAWTGGTWNGDVWTGSDFSGTSWAAQTWGSQTWSALTWSGQTWTARTWSSAVWSGSGWTARTWSARTWSARTWSAASWPDQPM
jgi:serine protease AprX